MTRTIPDQARLDFALALRRQWAGSVYPRLRAEYDTVLAKNRTRRRGGAAGVIHALPGYESFAWLERGSQKLLWRAVSEAVDHEPPDDAMTAGESTLALDPDLALPDGTRLGDCLTALGDRERVEPFGPVAQ